MSEKNKENKEEKESKEVDLNTEIDKLKAEIDRIGNIVRPLRYAEDMPFSRRKYLFMRDRNYVKKYRKYTF